MARKRRAEIVPLSRNIPLASATCHEGGNNVQRRVAPRRAGRRGMKTVSGDVYFLKARSREVLPRLYTTQLCTFSTSVDYFLEYELSISACDWFRHLSYLY